MEPVNRREEKIHMKGDFLPRHYSMRRGRSAREMKRSEFLDLCVQAAVKKDEPKVLYGGIEYYPEGYELRFDKSGKAVHRAILRDASKHNCLFYCPLAKVQEVEAT